MAQTVELGLDFPVNPITTLIVLMKTMMKNGVATMRIRIKVLSSGPPFTVPYNKLKK